MTDQTPRTPGSHAPPSSVTNAVRLMWVGAVLSIVGFVVGLIRFGAMRDAFEGSFSSSGLSGDQVETIINSTVVGVSVIQLIIAGLWAWMAIMNARGRNWARILGTVFFGISTLMLLSNLPMLGTMDWPTLIVNVALWAVGLAATILMWMSSSNPYYVRGASRMPGQGYAGPGPHQPPPMPTG